MQVVAPMHGRLQPPQCMLLVLVSTHAMLQHMFAEPGQPAPQPEQSLSVPSGVSQPFPTPPPQSAKPELHIPMAQVPVVQFPVAFGGAQGLLHAPQCVVVRSNCSHPVESIPSQLS